MHTRASLAMLQRHNRVVRRVALSPGSSHVVRMLSNTVCMQYTNLPRRCIPSALVAERRVSQHDVKLLERTDVHRHISRGHEFDSHCGRSLFRLWFLDFGCPACGEGPRATFGHEPVNPGPFGTGVVCALAVPYTTVKHTISAMLSVMAEASAATTEAMGNAAADICWEAWLDCWCGTCMQSGGLLRQVHGNCMYNMVPCLHNGS